MSSALFWCIVCFYRLNMTRNMIKNLKSWFFKKCKFAIKKAEKIIFGKGRLLVRKSGTESKIRIMCESEDKILLNKCIKIVSKSLK